MPEASPVLVTGFVVIALLVASGFVAGVHRAARGNRATPSDARRATVRWAVTVALWLTVTGLAASSGRLRFDGMPPTMMFVLVVALLGAIRIGWGAPGKRFAVGVPLALLVAFQAFRLPLELLMHQAFEQGLMPAQMSFSGYNFDIVTGALALPVAALYASGRASRRVVLAWNVLGSILLVNVVTIAMLSAPTPMRVFDNEPANVWITQWPFVWLPTVMVPAAIIGHLVIFRALRRAEGTSS